MQKSKVISMAVIAVIILGGLYVVATYGKGLSASKHARITMPEEAASPSLALGLNGSQDQTNLGQKSVTPVLSIAHNATLGEYLTASNGMTLYMYSKDTAGVSNCTATCATNWPPYVVSTNEPLLSGTGLNDGLATLTRADGSTQLTYKGVPLYFWSKDTKSGDTLGDGVGGAWSVAKPVSTDIDAE